MTQSQIAWQNNHPRKYLSIKDLQKLQKRVLGVGQHMPHRNSLNIRYLAGRPARRRNSLQVNNLREQPMQEHHQTKNDCTAHKMKHNKAKP